MKSWQKKFFFCNFLPNTDKEILDRIFLFNLFIAIFLLTAIPFGIMNAVMKNYIMTFMLFAGIIIIIGTRTYLCITKEHRMALTIATIMIALLLLSSYMTGGINNNGPLWYFAFPMAVLVLLGPLRGTIVSLSLILISLLLQVNPFSQVMMTTYTPEFLLMHFFSYLILFLLAFIYVFHKQKARKEIKELKGFLPICSICKKIRDDKGYWNQIEGFIQKYSDAQFSHGICPDCSKKYYSVFVKKD